MGSRHNVRFVQINHTINGKKLNVGQPFAFIRQNKTIKSKNKI